MKETLAMMNKTRFWKITILSVILLSFAGLVTYKVIAGTLGTSSTCPLSGACPVKMNSPPQGEANMACPVKSAADQKACKMLSDDGSKKTCCCKEQCDKKLNCDPAKKQCGI